MELRVFAPSISAATLDWKPVGGGDIHRPRRRRLASAAAIFHLLLSLQLQHALPLLSGCLNSTLQGFKPQRCNQLTMINSSIEVYMNSSNSSDSNHSQAGTNVLIHSGCAFCDPYGILQRIQYSAYSQDMCTCITVGSKQQTQRFSTQLLTTDTNCCWFQASEFRETRYFAFRSQVHNMLRKALINGINCSAIHPA
uniref:Uncharacterized protein n=1 Tax=Oryza glumipatula TaxID=40148 RepID=A0A0E0BCP8_9ORYZ